MEIPSLRLCNDAYVHFMAKNKNNTNAPLERCCTKEAIQAYLGGTNRVPVRLQFSSEDLGNMQDAVLVNATRCSEHEYRLKLELPGGFLLTLIAWVPEYDGFIVSWMEDKPTEGVILFEV